eukprot:5255568-Pyramimonas_sp.AAC.1
MRADAGQEVLRSERYSTTGHPARGPSWTRRTGLHCLRTAAPRRVRALFPPAARGQGGGAHLARHLPCTGGLGAGRAF